MNVIYNSNKFWPNSCINDNDRADIFIGPGKLFKLNTQLNSNNVFQYESFRSTISPKTFICKTSWQFKETWSYCWYHVVVEFKIFVEFSNTFDDLWSNIHTGHFNMWLSFSTILLNALPTSLCYNIVITGYKFHILYILNLTSCVNRPDYLFAQVYLCQKRLMKLPRSSPRRSPRSPSIPKSRVTRWTISCQERKRHRVQWYSWTFQNTQRRNSAHPCF